MDILFIVPAYKPILEQESIGTLILAKKLQLSGYSVRIMRYWEVSKDYSNYRTFIDKFIDNIKELPAHILSFYCRAAEYHICIDIAKRIKHIDSSIITVFGGPQADLTAIPTLKRFPWVDYVCCGEGENTIVPLLRFLLEPTLYQPGSIPGLVYRLGDQIIQNDRPEFLPNDYVRDYYYYDLIPSSVIEASREIAIDVGRGCPYSCTFCSTKLFWGRRFRLRQIENILDEIEFVFKKYKLRSFEFNHDLFTGNKKRILEFCYKLQERGLHIKWSCSSRANTIDHEMIDEMKKSGMVAIYFGIESGSERIQEKINKNLNLETIKDIVKYSVLSGVNVTTSFIYGFPEETEQDIEGTLELIWQFRKIGVHNIQLHRLSFDYGTEIYERAHMALVPPSDNYLINDYFGLAESLPMISENKEVFSTFFDFPNKLRDGLRFLPMFNIVCSTYPRTMDLILHILWQQGLNHLDIYRLYVNSSRTILHRIEKTARYNQDGISITIATFTLEKLIKSIHDSIKTNGLGSEVEYFLPCFQDERRKFISNSTQNSVLF